MSTQKTVKIEIYGETYNVRGEGDPEYLARLGKLVDDRMHEIASRLSTVDVKKLAILAALNIADEYSRKRDEQEAAMEHWMERAEKMMIQLDGELESSSDKRF